MLRMESYDRKCSARDQRRRAGEVRGLSKDDIAEITEKLNNRPRKALDYLTPNEVYYNNKKIQVQKLN